MCKFRELLLIVPNTVKTNWAASWMIENLLD